MKIFYPSRSMLLVIIFKALPVYLYAQSVGIGTNSPDASAQLDITNTTKGLLMPRMSTTAITTIHNPAKGLMVYDSAQNILMVNMGSPATPNWQTIAANSGWGLTGNSGTNAATNFIGTKDGASLVFKVNNAQAGYIDTGFNVTYNTAFGYKALSNNNGGAGNTANGFQSLYFNTTGYENTANGYQSLYFNTIGNENTAYGDASLASNTAGNYNVANGAYSLFLNNVGSNNTANGYRSLYSNTGGANNTANGYQSLFSNTDGISNTANGSQSLFSNTEGIENTANGIFSLYGNTTGSENTANGTYTLYANTTGYENTAIGGYSLTKNTTGFDNTANGYSTLVLNTTGYFNTATGESSLRYNTTGYDNTANGEVSLYSSTTGFGNTATGAASLYSNNSGNRNTANGYYALRKTTASDYNTAIGYNAGASYDLGTGNTFLGANCDAFAGASNDIAIGQAVTCTANNQARIGNSGTISIGGYANWTNISDGRYKKNLKEDVKGLDFIMKLRPVTYNLDITALDQKLNENRGKKMNIAMKTAILEKEQITQTGFVAQEVEKAANETGYNFSGIDKPKTDSGLYGLRYAEFVVPLVKAVQEQQQEIDLLKEQNKKLEEQNKIIMELLNKK